MKKMKKIFALLIAMVMVLGMSTAVFAQSVAKNPADADAATITISNASRGETYKVYKIFDATVTGTTDGSIAYQGTIPATLTDYFEYVNGTDSTNGIKVKDAGKDSTDPTKLSTAAVDALKAYVATADVKDTYLVSAESDGSALTFTGLPYGFYVVTSTQDNGAAITVDSTNPNATIIDKNDTPPVENPTKKADDTNVYIGQTVTYTVNFGTANYDGSKQIVKYEIADTLPSYLENVTVTSIKVIETAAVADDPATTDVDETVAEVATDLTSLGANFATAKKITIPWTENQTSPYGASKYKNGSTIQIVYTAKVGSDAVVDGNGNKNKVTITYTTDDGQPHEDTTVVEETIYTYAAALQKIDENKKPLAGATFAANGLTVSGSAGDYIVTAYDKTSTTPGTTMECDAQGQLVIRGLPSDETLTITEIAAPDGYNKLTSTETLKPVVISEEVKSESKTIYYDADGKVTDEQTETSYTKTTYNVNLLKEAKQILNQKGAELPSTGGIGTTIFYIIGAILVIGAGVVLVTRRRMNAN